MEHQHVWTLVMHLDRCHLYENYYSCPCGASRKTSDEREGTGLSAAIWLLPSTCERCRELAAGAEPHHHEQLLEAGERD